MTRSIILLLALVVGFLARPLLRQLRRRCWPHTDLVRSRVDGFAILECLKCKRRRAVEEGSVRALDARIRTASFRWNGREIAKTTIGGKP